MSLKNRREYLSKFLEQENGEYEYSGAYYRFPGDEKEERRVRIRMSLYALAITAVVLFSGTISAAGASNAFYVILPLLGEVCALFAAWWYLSKMLFHRGMIREYVFDRSWPRIGPALLILTGFSVMGLLGALIYVLSHGFENEIKMALIYFITKVLAALLAILCKKYYDGISWEKV